MQQMTLQKLHWFLDLFEELELTVWLDGGWAVDALLGEQTRDHADVDIMIPGPDSARLVRALLENGFHEAYTDDRADENFVMEHPGRGQIDFHVFELRQDGSGMYRPGLYDWAISAEELAGQGAMDGRTVRCLTPEYQVRSHSGYTLKATDLHDMAALRDRFGVRLLDEHVRALERKG